MATPTLQAFSNDLIVKKADYRFAGTFTDENKLVNMFGYDNVKGDQYLGFLSVFNQWSQISAPILMRLINNKNIIYTNNNADFISYSLRYKIEAPTVKSDLTWDIEKPGIDGQLFEIHLGDGGMESVFQIGDRLTADYFDGQNVIVREVGSRLGEGFKYKVQLVANKKTEWYDKKYLAPGTEYFKVGHTTDEYGERGTGLSQGYGEMQLQHRLGGWRMAEYTITGEAQRLQVSGKVKRGAFEFDLQNLNKYGNLADAMNGGYLAVGKNDGKGNIKPGTLRWIPFIEAMLHAELTRLEELDLMFSQGGTVTGSRNQTVTVGQGLYQQMKLGNWIPIPRYTRAAVIDAFQYVYRNRTDIPYEKRYFKLDGGFGAVYEYAKIFEQELNRTANQVGAILDAWKMGIVSGDALNLKVGYKVGTVLIPGVGWVSIEHNPAFDAFHGRETDQPQIGGLGKRSYTSCIWDLTDSASTNAAQPSSDVEFAKGFNDNANIYLVKDKNMPGVKITHLNGRTSPYPVSAGGGTIASTRRDVYTQQIESRSNIFLADKTRSVLLELKPNA